MLNFQTRLIYFYSFLVSYEYVYTIFGFDSVLKPYRIIAILIIIVMAFQAIKTRVLIFDIFDKLFLFLFILGFILALNTSGFYNVSAGTAGFFITTDSGMESTINIVVLTFLTFSVGVAIKNCNLNIDNIKTIIKFYMYGVFGNVVFILYQSLGAFGYRLNGFYKGPSILGSAIGFLFLYLIYRAFSDSVKKTEQVLIFIVLPFLLYAVVLTGSRTSIVMMVLGLSFYVIFHINFKVIFFSIATIVAGLILSVNAPQNLLHRFTLEGTSSGAGRVDSWNAAYLIFEERPLLGIGMGQFYNVSIEYVLKLEHVLNSTVLDYNLAIHNVYISLIIEYGLLGSLVYMSIQYLLFRNTIRSSRILKNKELSSFFIIILIMIGVQGMFQEFFTYPTYFLLLSLIVLHNRLVKESVKVF